MNPLGFALAAALGNVAGALAVVRHLRRGLRFIDACLAFGAGFMLAVTVLGVLPEVLHTSPNAAIFVLLDISRSTWRSTSSPPTSTLARRRTASAQPRAPAPFWG